MTGKERAAFRAQANGLETILQIGKSGLTETVLRQIEDMLTAKELIKIRLLESAPVAVRECADEIAAKTGADVIQMIGSKIVLYRYSPELHEKQRVKAKNIKMMKTLAIQKQRIKRAKEQKINAKSGKVYGRKQENRTQKENRNLWR